MEDVIEVMKLLCYEMMELQRNYQDTDAPVGRNTQVVWELLQQQADTLAALLTTQLRQVRLVVLGPMCCAVMPKAVMWRFRGTCCCCWQPVLSVCCPCLLVCRYSRLHPLPSLQALATCSLCTRVPASECWVRSSQIAPSPMDN
jgi:hypothetical protein